MFRRSLILLCVFVLLGLSSAYSLFDPAPTPPRIQAGGENKSLYLSAVSRMSVLAQGPQSPVPIPPTNTPVPPTTTATPSDTPLPGPSDTPTATGTPPPEQGYIIEAEAALAFPVELRTRALLGIRAESLTLGQVTVTQPGGDYAEAVTVDFETMLEDTGFDTVSVRLTVSLLAGEVTPEPFQPLVVRWQFAADGQIAEYRQEILFQPEGDWRQGGAPPYLLWSSSERLAVNVLRDNLMPVYDLLAQHTGVTPDFQFVLYEPDARLCVAAPDDPAQQVLVGAEDDPCEALATYYAGHDLIPVQRPDNSFGEIQALLTAESVRRFYARAWADAPDDLPAWLLAGLERLYRQMGNANALFLAQNAALSNNLLLLDELATPRSDTDRDLFGAQSYLLLLYLADAYGAAAPFTLANTLSGADSFGAALEDITGVRPRTFYRQWRAWLDSQAAEVALLWNPYLSDTPTPTPTVTPSSLPPTPTPTASPTITLTPTSTSLIGRLPTLPPTRTPTATSNAEASPTNTPRPPGSLRQATPQPAAQEADDGGLPCASPALIIPMLGIVIMVRRRRTP